jgi:1-acyl-sn-glycerol-3-phosphate acyltransferase
MSLVDADLIPHLLYLLSSGAVDVTVSWGEAAACDMARIARRLPATPRNRCDA